MRILNVKITAHPTQFSIPQPAPQPNGPFASWMVLQNSSASDAMYLGDNTTLASTTNGIKIAGAASLIVGEFTGRGTLLTQWYVDGTIGDVLTVLYEDSMA